MFISRGGDALPIPSMTLRQSVCDSQSVSRWMARVERALLPAWVRHHKASRQECRSTTHTGIGLGFTIAQQSVQAELCAIVSQPQLLLTQGNAPRAAMELGYY